MKNIAYLLLLLMLSFTLTACGGKEGTVTEKQFDQLEEGMTKADIKETFGAPLEEDENKWIYDLKKEDRTIELTLFFNGDELMGSTTASKQE